METPVIDSSVIVPAGTDEPVKNRQIRALQRIDARLLHDLIVRCPPLDPNSLYAYALLALHHSSTCFVAVANQKICGAVTGYIPPEQPDTYFLWQVAVAPEQQGTGLGLALLDHVQQHCMAPKKLHFLETTISPGNLASQRLFSRFAQRQGVDIQRFTCLSSQELQPVHAQADHLVHEAEDLYRLGSW
ncbi:diaminobutyrate acetyltransferase [Alkanindiges sp. WGS2144]|uniref:diaminobutyrate acetyltransferase n=1 Tax=Alkanindiges sp. WGS2144 TaxID=3366808 RepID=UPI00375119B9